MERGGRGRGRGGSRRRGGAASSHTSSSNSSNSQPSSSHAVSDFASTNTHSTGPGMAGNSSNASHSGNSSNIAPSVAAVPSGAGAVSTSSSAASVTTAASAGNSSSATARTPTSLAQKGRAKTFTPGYSDHSPSSSRPTRPERPPKAASNLSHSFTFSTPSPAPTTSSTAATTTPGKGTAGGAGAVQAPTMNMRTRRSTFDVGADALGGADEEAVSKGGHSLRRRARVDYSQVEAQDVESPTPKIDAKPTLATPASTRGRKRRVIAQDGPANDDADALPVSGAKRQRVSRPPRDTPPAPAPTTGRRRRTNNQRPTEPELPSDQPSDNDVKDTIEVGVTLDSDSGSQASSTDDALSESGEEEEELTDERDSSEQPSSTSGWLGKDQKLTAEPLAISRPESQPREELTSHDEVVKAPASPQPTKDGGSSVPEAVQTGKKSLLVKFAVKSESLKKRIKKVLRLISPSPRPQTPEEPAAQPTPQSQTPPEEEEEEEEHISETTVPEDIEKVEELEPTSEPVVGPIEEPAPDAVPESPMKTAEEPVQEKDEQPTEQADAEPAAESEPVDEPLAAPADDERHDSAETAIIEEPRDIPMSEAPALIEPQEHATLPVEEATQPMAEDLPEQPIVERNVEAPTQQHPTEGDGDAPDEQTHEKENQDSEGAKEPNNTTIESVRDVSPPSDMPVSGPPEGQEPAPIKTATPPRAPPPPYRISAFTEDRDILLLADRLPEVQEAVDFFATPLSRRMQQELREELARAKEREPSQAKDEDPSKAEDEDYSQAKDEDPSLPSLPADSVPAAPVLIPADTEAPEDQKDDTIEVPEAMQVDDRVVLPEEAAVDEQAGVEEQAVVPDRAEVETLAVVPERVEAEDQNEEPIAVDDSRPWACLTPYIPGSTRYPEVSESSPGTPSASQDEQDAATDGTGDAAPAPGETKAAQVNGLPKSPGESGQGTDTPRPKKIKQYSYPKIRDPNEFVEAISNFSAMSTDELFDCLAVINNSLCAWQDEYVEMRKISDAEYNAPRRRVDDLKEDDRISRAIERFKEKGFYEVETNDNNGQKNQPKGFQLKRTLEPRRWVMEIDKDGDEARADARANDKVMAQAYGFEYDSREIVIGRQEPLDQRDGAFNKPRTRARPKQTLKAAEAEAEEGILTTKRIRKRRVLDDESRPPSRASTPAPPPPPPSMRKARRGRNALADSLVAADAETDNAEPETEPAPPPPAAVPPPAPAATATGTGRKPVKRQRGPKGQYLPNTTAVSTPPSSQEAPPAEEKKTAEEPATKAQPTRKRRRGAAVEDSPPPVAAPLHGQPAAAPVASGVTADDQNYGEPEAKRARKRIPRPDLVRPANRPSKAEIASGQFYGGGSSPIEAPQADDPKPEDSRPTSSSSNATTESNYMLRPKRNRNYRDAQEGITTTEAAEEPRRKRARRGANAAAAAPAPPFAAMPPAQAPPQVHQSHQGHHAHPPTLLPPAGHMTNIPPPMLQRPNPFAAPANGSMQYPHSHPHAHGDPQHGSFGVLNLGHRMPAEAHHHHHPPAPGPSSIGNSGPVGVVAPSGPPPSSMLAMPPGRGGGGPPPPASSGVGTQQHPHGPIVAILPGAAPNYGGGRRPRELKIKNIIPVGPVAILPRSTSASGQGSRSASGSGAASRAGSPSSAGISAGGNTCVPAGFAVGAPGGGANSSSSAAPAASTSGPATPAAATPTGFTVSSGSADEPEKDYASMTKSEKMSHSMRSRWRNGSMQGAVAKRKETLRLKKVKAQEAEADFAAAPPPVLAPAPSNGNPGPSAGYGAAPASHPYSVPPPSSAPGKGAKRVAA